MPNKKLKLTVKILAVLLAVDICLSLGKSVFFICVIYILIKNYYINKKDICKNKSCGKNGFCQNIGGNAKTGSICLCNNSTSFGQTCDDNTTQSNPCLNKPIISRMLWPVISDKSMYVKCNVTEPIFFLCPKQAVFNRVFQSCATRV